MIFGVISPKIRIRTVITTVETVEAELFVRRPDERPAIVTALTGSWAGVESVTVSPSDREKEV